MEEDSSLLHSDENKVEPLPEREEPIAQEEEVVVIQEVEDVKRTGSTNGDMEEEEGESLIVGYPEETNIHINVGDSSDLQEPKKENEKETPPRFKFFENFLQSTLERIITRKGYAFTIVWLIRNLVLTYSLFLAGLFLIIWNISITLSTFYTIRQNGKYEWWNEFQNNHPLIPEFQFTTTVGSVSALMIMILVSASIFHRMVMFLIYFVWSRKQYSYVADILLLKYGDFFCCRLLRSDPCSVFCFKVVIQFALFIQIEVLPLPIALFFALLAVLQNQDFKALISMIFFFMAISMLITNTIWWIFGVLENYYHVCCFFCCFGRRSDKEEEKFFEKRVSIVADTIIEPTVVEEYHHKHLTLNEDRRKKKEEKKKRGRPSKGSEDNLIRIIVYFCWYMNPLQFQVSMVWICCITCIAIVFLLFLSLFFLLYSTVSNYNDFFVSFPLMLFNAWWMVFLFLIVLFIVLFFCVNYCVNCVIKIPKRDPIDNPLSSKDIKWYEFHKRLVFFVEEMFHHSPRLITRALKWIILADIVVFFTVTFFFTPFRGFITGDSVRAYIRQYIDMLLFCFVLFANLIGLLLCYHCRYNWKKYFLCFLIYDVFKKVGAKGIVKKKKFRHMIIEDENSEVSSEEETNQEEEEIEIEEPEPVVGDISSVPDRSDYSSLEEGGGEIEDQENEENEKEDKEEQNEENEEEKEETEESEEEEEVEDEIVVPDETEPLIQENVKKKKKKKKKKPKKVKKTRKGDEIEELEKDQSCFCKYGSVSCLLSSICFWFCLLYSFIFISWFSIIIWSTTGSKGIGGLFFISFNIFSPFVYPCLTCCIGGIICDRHRHYQNCIRYCYFALFMIILGVIFFAAGLHDFGKPNDLTSESLLKKEKFSGGPRGKLLNDEYFICKKRWSGLDIVDIGFMTELSYKVCSPKEPVGACGMAWMKHYFPDLCTEGIIAVPDFSRLEDPDLEIKKEYQYFFEMYKELGDSDTCLIRSPQEDEDVKFYHIYSAKYKFHVLSIRGTKTLLDYIQDFNLWKEIALIQVINFFVPVLQNFGNRFVRIIVVLWDFINRLVSGNILSFFPALVRHFWNVEFMPSINSENAMYYYKVEDYVKKNILCRRWETDSSLGIDICRNVTEGFSQEEKLYITGHSLGGGLSKIVGMSMILQYDIGNRDLGSGKGGIFTPVTEVIPFSFAGPGLIISSGKFFEEMFVLKYFLQRKTGVFEERLDDDLINIKPEVDIVSSIDFLGGTTQRIGCPIQNFLGCHSSSTILQTLLDNCGNTRYPNRTLNG